MSAVPRIELRPFAVRNALLVGSDFQTEEQVRNVLEPGSWTIQRARDNATVLAMVQKKNFDLILTSEKTSGKEDVELLRKLRCIRPHTRLIILTEESTPADVITSMREHAFSHFSKPFSVVGLAAMIR